MTENAAWRDWCRTEECIRFGVKRWIWVGLALFLIQKHVYPESEGLAIVLEMGAVAAQFAYIKWDDARRAAHL